jgi:hypothetical protein
VPFTANQRGGRGEFDKKKKKYQESGTLGIMPRPEKAREQASVFRQ